jgi:DHA2 family multidrug resistance protein
VPQYLTLVQGYSAFQTGEAMVWVGLPQLIIFPFVPVLMKRFDLRALVCFGVIVFATSCWMNTAMSHDYAGQQLAFANVVRALGQPFTIIPLASIATATLTPREAPDGSAIFNITRNLGGSVGTAVLDTLVTRREEFHDFRIGESVNEFRIEVQDRINILTQQFQTAGFEGIDATNKAYAQLKETVRREAYVMAFNDAFLIVSIALLSAAVLVWLCRKTIAKEGSAGH